MSTNIDHLDAEVQHHFTMMKKTPSEKRKKELAEELAAMYEKNDGYSYGIFTRAYKFISEAGEDRRVGLLVLTAVGLKMQGIARSTFVNKFHSPVFKLFEVNNDQLILRDLERAYEVLLQIGANQNDQAIETDYSIAIHILTHSSKDVRKMGGYSIVRILINQSPYITFKRLLKKRKRANGTFEEPDLELIMREGKSRSLKIRKEYIRFLEEYVKYISERKDINFQNESVKMFLNPDQAKEKSEQAIHIYMETLRLFLKNLYSVIRQEEIKDIITFSLEKIVTNKSRILQKSLIELLPLITQSSLIENKTLTKYLLYLRSINGEDQIIAQNAINEILKKKTQEIDMERLHVLKTIFNEIHTSFNNVFQKPELINEQLITKKVKTVQILLKHNTSNIEKLISKKQLQQVASNSLILKLDDQTRKLVGEISKYDYHSLSISLEKKLVIMISKILTGSSKKPFRSHQLTPELTQFIEKIEKSTIVFQTDENKVRAIETLSFYRFREEHKETVGGFIKDKVLKYYLQWGTWKIRQAAIESAFNLYAKKGNTIAQNQMLEILDKILRSGMTDEEEVVRLKVFSCLQKNLQQKQIKFQQYLTQKSLLHYFYQALEDRNPEIRIIALRIVTYLCRKRPSALIIPFLKKFLFNLIQYLSTNFRYFPEKNYLINALAILIQRSPDIIQSHVGELLEIILGYLGDRKNYEGMQLIFFKTFEHLIRAHPMYVLPYAKQICYYVIEALNDRLNHAKRKQSLKILIQLIQSCGYVVLPYFQLPQLSETLVYLMKSQIDNSSRQDLLRILGGLGAIDIYKQQSLKKMIGVQTRFGTNRQKMIQQNKMKYHEKQLLGYYDEILLLSTEKNIKVSGRQPLIKKSVNTQINHLSQKLKLEQAHNLHNFNLIIIGSLIELINDNTVIERQQLVFDSLQSIFKILGNELEKDLPTILSFLLSKPNKQITELLILLLRHCDVGYHLHEIVDYLLENCPDIELFLNCLDIMTYKYQNTLTVKLKTIINKLYDIVRENSKQTKLMVKVVLIYCNLKSILEPYLSQILPQLLRTFFNKVSQVTKATIDFIMVLVPHTTSLALYLSQISHLFATLLEACARGHPQCKPYLRNQICNCTVLLLIHFSDSFMSYLPIIHRAIMKCDESHPLYTKAIHIMENCYYGSIKHHFSPEELERISPDIKTPFFQQFEMTKVARKIQGADELIHEFDPIGKKFVEQDWVEWLKKTSIFLLRKSPNLSLRICADLAESYTEIAYEFYNMSFYFFWEVLLDGQKKQLIENLKTILTLEPRPYPLIRKTILNLAEFMNRKKCSFELSNSLLATTAKETLSFAKNLYYRQLEFQVNPQGTIQQLIDVYMKLGQPQNVYGLFKIAEKLGMECKVQWYEKLGKWEQAYEKYNKKEDSIEIQSRKLMCLSKFDNERFLDELQNFEEAKNSSQISALGALCYAQLEQWDRVQVWSSHIKESSEHKPFWQSILSLRSGNYTESLQFIEEFRRKTFDQISELISFSASPEAFQKVFKLQKLFQIEEIIEIKMLEEKIKNSSKREKNEEQIITLKQELKSKKHKIQQIWSDRLIGGPRDQQIWSKLVYIRSLLFSKLQYFEFFYKYCEICIEQNKIYCCERMINKFKKEISVLDQKPESKIGLIDLLQLKIRLICGLIHDQQVIKIEQFLADKPHIEKKRAGEIYELCAFALQQKVQSNDQTRHHIIKLINESIALKPSEKLFQKLGDLHLASSTSSSCQNQECHMIHALSAYMRSLQLSQVNSQFFLQGFLKVLSIIFSYHHIEEVEKLFLDKFQKVPVQGWILVVPQMMAHLCENQKLRTFIGMIKKVLKFVGLSHPESLLYSLNFAIRSKITERIAPAQQILQLISEKYPQLTDEIEKISSQLGKASIKLNEFWYDSIQSAWTIFNQTKDTKQVLIVLKELKQELTKRKKTNSQLSFHQQFGIQIYEAFQWIQQFEKTSNPMFFSMAFEIFTQVYRKVKQSFENMKKIYLKNVSPFLVSSHAYLSSIPGTYSTKLSQNIKISSFRNELPVILSKQRPRKLRIYGSDGKQYHFLLKGRQDMRLDQRVMQFLGLVNKLLSLQRQRLRKNLQITRYEIIPLTMKTGLIGWVENCDTINELIRQYRTTNKIKLNVEKEIYERTCFDYKVLPMANKLQIFMNGLENTQGNDLARILWLKSQNSETWVERRSNFTVSLATMSIVGYILGLGDRHPSNILIDRESGKVVHIDFGDCFEVAVLRENFPEKVPFRLTRMLEKAMGIAGMHGLYRETCISVMKVLRQNKDTLLSVLETFVHDPILSWRIVGTKKKDEEEEKEKDDLQKKQFQNEVPIYSQNPPKQQNQMINSIMSHLEQVMKPVKQDNSPQQNVAETPAGQTFNLKPEQTQKINEKALYALIRIKKKLMGRDFQEEKILKEDVQIDRLIKQAVSYENLCQSWPGWCPFW